MTIDELAAVQTIDLTTIGRSSGKPRRIEIWWFQVDGQFIITGTPGPRDWYANVLNNPEVIVHVGDHDVAATAEPIEDEPTRRAVMTDEKTSWYTTQVELEHLVANAPMITLVLRL